MGLSLVALLTLHIILSFAFFAFLKEKKMAIALFPIVFCIPYLGLAALIIFYFYSKTKKHAKEYEKEEVFLKTSKMINISQIDQNKEKNIIPVEEALIVNDHQIQRQMVMEVAKRNPKEYLNELKKALLASDTETAHYAASSILELKRDYDKEVIKAQKNYDSKNAMDQLWVHSLS